MISTIAWTSIAVAVAASVVGLIILYFVVFLAVRNALRSHTIWAADEAAFRQATGGDIIRRLD